MHMKDDIFVVVSPGSAMSFFAFPIAEQYTYVDESIAGFCNADRLCQERGYLHLAVMDTAERQHMFSIAMAIKYRWV